jgi:hypothetical protein
MGVIVISQHPNGINIIETPAKIIEFKYEFKWANTKQKIKSRKRKEEKNLTWTHLAEQPSTTAHQKPNPRPGPAPLRSPGYLFT